jgi:hypothetical protein
MPAHGKLSTPFGPLARQNIQVRIMCGAKLLTSQQQRRRKRQDRTEVSISFSRAHH